MKLKEEYQNVSLEEELINILKEELRDEETENVEVPQDDITRIHKEIERIRSNNLEDIYTTFYLLTQKMNKEKMMIEIEENGILSTIFILYITYMKTETDSCKIRNTGNVDRNKIVINTSKDMMNRVESILDSISIGWNEVFVIKEAFDPLYLKAVEVVKETNYVSSSYIQRKLKVLPKRADKILNEMEERGVISKYKSGEYVVK